MDFASTVILMHLKQQRYLPCMEVMVLQMLYEIARVVLATLMSSL